MGIYYNHGVEYRVFLKNGQILIVVPTNESDGLLILSEYYKKREEEWLIHREPFCKPVEDGFSLPLSEKHQKMLNKAFEQFPNDIAHHGWYEVNTVTQTH